MYHTELVIIEQVGQGAFGHVYKAAWRGTIVAAKDIPIAGNKRILENELSVYRYDWLKAYWIILLYLYTLNQRSLNHPNLLNH